MGQESLDTKSKSSLRFSTAKMRDRMINPYDDNKRFNELDKESVKSYSVPN